MPSRGLRRHCVVAELTERLADEPGLVARLARALLARIATLNHDINAFEREIRDRVRSLAPSLLELPGCGVLSAAVLLGESADVRRFRSRDAFARFTGTAPIPVWSGNSDRVRLNRGGNRTVNCALHIVAVTQARGVGELGKAYVDKHIAAGKTKREALRLLRRRLSDAAFTALRADAHLLDQPDANDNTEVVAATDAAGQVAA